MKDEILNAYITDDTQFISEFLTFLPKEEKIALYYNAYTSVRNIIKHLNSPDKMNIKDYLILTGYDQ